MKRTLKNVKRLQWFCFVMWLWAGALILWAAQLAASGVFAENIVLCVILSIVAVLGWVFWLLGFVSYIEIEQEIREKAEGQR